MLEQMQQRLPIYESYVEELTLTAKDALKITVKTVDKVGKEACSRIRRALAYVYADLIQFCHDVCVIFSKKRSREFLPKF